MVKICIFGPPGAGKSYISKKLAVHLDIPLHELDPLFFQDNWQERPVADFLEMYNKILVSPKWLIDGNSMHHLEARFAIADIAVYFHLPKFFCLKNIIKRRYNSSGQTLTWKLVKYLWNFDRRYSYKIAQLQQRYPLVQLIEVKHKNAFEKLFTHLKNLVSKQNP